MTYDVGNPSPVLGHVRKCGGVKMINGIPILHWSLFLTVFFLFQTLAVLNPHEWTTH